MTTTVTAALDVAESAILAALNAISPINAAYWSGENTSDDVRRLNPTVSDYRSRFYIAQHQDGGGQREHWLSHEGWRGLVVVKCLSKSKADAQTGYDLTIAAMQGIAHPTGYRVFVQFDRPISIPRDTTQIYTRAAQWTITIRKTDT